MFQGAVSGLVQSEKLLSFAEATIASHCAPTVDNPADHFLFSRFKNMTPMGKAGLLADIELKLDSNEQGIAEKGSAELAQHGGVIRRALGKIAGDSLSKEEIRDFFLNLPDRGQRIMFKNLASEPASRKVLEDSIYAYLRTRLPAVAYTLAHVYEGGVYGLLTSRESRDQHGVQIALIAEQIGFAPQLETVYYISDREKNKRLSCASSPAERKATVLLNFASGFKLDEQGRLAPMTLGRKFDEIIFIDDEDKNLKEVLYTLVRAVSHSILSDNGLKYRTDGYDTLISKRARELSESGYQQRGVACAQDTAFWLNVAREAFPDDSKGGKLPVTAEEAISRLMAKGDWLPGILKVLDGRCISHDECEARLRKCLARPGKLETGSKNSIIFNDIDGNLLEVNPVMPIVLKDDPTVCLREVTARELGEHPFTAYWINLVSEEHRVPADKLEFRWDHFRQAELIVADILSAMHKDKITENRHGSGIQ